MDIETIWRSNIATPISIAITTSRHSKAKTIKTWEDPEVIIKFMLETCKNNKIYYVHNLTFEALVFIRYLTKMGIQFKIVSHNKVVYSMTLIHNKKKIQFRCSYRLTLLPLKKLADLCGVNEKTPFPYKILNENLKEVMKLEENDFNTLEDFKKFVSNNNEIINTYKIIEEYCINDAEITKKAINKYWNVIEDGGLKYNKRILTAAKLSIQNFFTKPTEVKKKIDIKIDRIIRKGYFGGRTEVFGNPKKNELMLHFDWSGMYAQCMCEKVPGGAIFESKSRDIKQPGFYLIVAEQNMDIPILPIKEDKLYFKNGIIKGWYWFEEIQLFIENGGKILEVISSIKSEYYEKFISNFVEINNKIREKGSIHKQIGKNNNNTFYGRLGMNPERLEEEILTTFDINEINDKKCIKIANNMGIFTKYTKSEKSISNVSISAAITSKARVKLYKGFNEVKKIGGRVLYCDTDSIIAAFSSEKYKDVINKQIGEIYFDSTKEDTEIIDAVFCLPKTYGIKLKNGKEIIKIKGFNSTPTFDELKKSFYENINIITKNKQWSKKSFQIEVKDVIKQINLRTLDKRIWQRNLKDTRPHTLQNPT